MMSLLTAWTARGGLCAAAALCAAVTAHAQDQAPAAPHELPMSVEARYDPARIDGGERLGLLGTSLLFEVSPGWWGGPSVVGAVAGNRGGYLVLGGEVARRWQWSERWRAQASLMAGGGSGADTPVGAGLLVVPSVALLYDWGHVQTGLAWSRTRTPSGRIDSQQFGLVLNWDGRFTYFDAADIGRRASGDEGRGLGFDRLMLSHAYLHTRAQPDVPASSVRMLGVRAERRAGEHVYWGLEAAAASHGAADGYMEILGSGGWETSASAIGLDSVHLGARAALGVGGGGGLKTGGGVLGKAAGVLRWDWGRDAFMGLEVGRVRSDSGRYGARYAQVQVGWQIGGQPGGPTGSQAAGLGGADALTVHGLSWSASVQHVVDAARKDGGSMSFDTVGIKLDSMLGEQFYLTGQAHSQVTGQAGAYSVGLAGLGWRAPIGARPWSLSAELLAGAAGGGGFDTRGGAVVQGVAYLGWELRPGGTLRFGAGRVRSLKGGMNAPVFDLSWTQSFGVGQR